MVRNWAITIGINRYRYLQPLKYGMSDADTVRQFFTQELKFHQVYHFTEQSLPIPQDYGPALDSQPTSTTLGRFLRRRFEQPFLKTGDNLWFFFAGHGIRNENRDYLMPIDGDREDLERSAIPLHYISERLQRSGADNVIMLIDACRNGEGRRDSCSFGEEKQQGVITLYSCSPDEASYEIEEIGGGAFTRVLLDSLRLQGEGNCATVERLYQRLRHHVPQLTRSYRHDTQTPYGRIEPPSKSHLILLPQQATLTDVIALKNDALSAEIEQDFEAARHLWIRVLIVSPGDPAAILGIERLSRGGRPPQPSTSRASARARSATSFAPFSAFRQRMTRASRPTKPSPTKPGLTQPKALPPPEQSPSRARAQPSRKPSTAVNRSLSRRQALQILGVIGGGLGTVAVSRILSQSEGGSSAPTISAASTALIASDFTPVDFETAQVSETGEIIRQETLQGHVYKERIADSVLELVPIPGGTFQMGSPEGQGYDRERPQHRVTVSPFLMGRYAVTQAQWQAVSALPKVEQDLESDPSRFKGAERPVEQISWDDAVEFCRRLTAYSGREYRLPSEAEWEYGCRAGTTTAFHYGETITTELANYRGTDWEYEGTTYPGNYGSGPKGEYREETLAVGSFPANAFGLYDTHGNVWEWCQDYWHDSYAGAPSDGSAWIEGGDASKRLLRGGSWGSNPDGCRSASRYWYARDYWDNDVGFRVVCAASWTLA